jgi:glycosyltransferase involved in cell wall biosynthesis
MDISIVTPSLNQGQYLAETIESVISQEGHFRLDYIIIDGGSSDNSVDIIRQYEKRLLQGEWPIACQGITYRWLSEKDKGQANALMKGFRTAGGEVLAWLNSDDTYLPGTLQTAAGFFRDHPDTGLLYGDAHFCDTAGNIIGRYRTEEFNLERLASFNIICQPSAFFRRNAFEAVGCLDESLRFAMDYDLWAKIGKQFPCRYFPWFLSTYRLHETSKTICDDTLHDNLEEVLLLAIKHFDWAPLTRVYASCHYACSTRLPAFLGRIRLVLVSASITCSLFRSVCLNRGVRGKDLKLLTLANLGKLFKTRFEIMVQNK